MALLLSASVTLLLFTYNLSGVQKSDNLSALVVVSVTDSFLKGQIEVVCELQGSKNDTFEVLYPEGYCKVGDTLWLSEATK